MACDMACNSIAFCYRQMNKHRREKGREQKPQKNILQADGDKEMNSVIPEVKEKSDEIWVKNM